MGLPQKGNNMKKLFFALVLATVLVGCKSKKVYPTPDTTGYSADFPTTEVQDGRAMPEYTPYWKQK